MPKLTVTKGPLKGQTFSFGGESIFVGRSAENDIHLKVGQVSRKHFKIYSDGKKSYIEDLISKNGTAINGETIVPGKVIEVRDNDIITIANTELMLTGLPKAKVATHAVDAGTEKQTKPAKERRGGDRKTLDLIWGVTEILRETADITEVLDKVTTYLLNALPRIDTSVILLYDKKRAKVWDTVAKVRHEDPYQKIQYSKNIVDRVTSEGKAIRMSNMKYENPDDLTDSIQELGIKSIMCVPLISNAEILGAIYVDSRGTYGFRKDDLLLLNSLSGPVAVAVEKAILAATLQGIS